MQAPKYSPLHQAARDYASAGYAVFPCIADGKKPACPRGFHEATVDLDQIDRWWRKNPFFNIGWVPDSNGLCVIDVEKKGLARFQDWIGGREFPVTRKHRSWSGGVHYLFAGKLRSLTRPFGAEFDIDTRGEGGYILLPPSMIEGQAYKVANLADPQPLPEWVSESIKPAEEPVKAPVVDLELDKPANILRARKYLEYLKDTGQVCIEGQGGDAEAYKVCCKLRDLGISKDEAAILFADDFNMWCLPPWSEQEIETHIEHAYKYAKNEAGSQVPLAVQMTPEALDKLLGPPSPLEIARPGRFHALDDDEMDQPFEVKWHVKDLIPCASTVMLYGPTQSYKSFVALDLALGIATGKDTLGITPDVTGPVFYGALEGRTGIARKRRPAWRKHRGVTGKTDFYVMPAPLVASQPECAEFVKEIQLRCAGRKPALVVIDTVSKAMVGYDSTKDADKLVAFCDALVEILGCSVLAVHHTGHDVERGPRDSSVYRAGFDTVLQVTSPKKGYSSVRVVKHKDSEELENPIGLRATQVDGSLVFDPCPAEELTPPPKDSKKVEAARQDAIKNEELTGPVVGERLRIMGAIGRDSYVSSEALADALTPPLGSDADPIVRQVAIEATKKRLLRRAQADLAGYCTRVGTKTYWYLPDS